MKVFIDFDDTIFCTKNFIKDFFHIFQKNGVSQEIFSSTYYSENVKIKGKTKYHLGNQLERLEKMGFDSAKINKGLDKFLSSSAKYIFPDAKFFLKNFTKKELYLLSYSQTDFQKEKIVKSEVTKFFQKVIITDKKKSQEIKKIIKNKKEKIFFIDDWNTQIDEVKKALPEMVTIFLKRKMGRYKNEKSQKCDFEAKNLREVFKIITKLKEG